MKTMPTANQQDHTFTHLSISKEVKKLRRKHLDYLKELERESRYRLEDTPLFDDGVPWE